MCVSTQAVAARMSFSLLPISIAMATRASDMSSFDCKPLSCYVKSDVSGTPSLPAKSVTLSVLAFPLKTELSLCKLYCVVIRDFN